MDVQVTIASQHEVTKRKQFWLHYAIPSSQSRRWGYTVGARRGRGRGNILEYLDLIA